MQRRSVTRWAAELSRALREIEHGRRARQPLPAPLRLLSLQWSPGGDSDAGVSAASRSGNSHGHSLRVRGERELLQLHRSELARLLRNWVRLRHAEGCVENGSTTRAAARAGALEAALDLALEAVRRDGLVLPARAQQTLRAVLDRLREDQTGQQVSPPPGHRVNQRVALVRCLAVSLRLEPCAHATALLAAELVRRGHLAAGCRTYCAALFGRPRGPGDEAWGARARPVLAAAGARGALEPGAAVWLGELARICRLRGDQRSALALERLPAVVRSRKLARGIPSAWEVA